MIKIVKSYFNGWGEIIRAFHQWRIAHMIGYSNLRNRYARSKLGQFWVTLSTGIMVLCFGLVWSMLWGMSIEKYLPYVAAAQTMFIFISSVMNESATVIQSSAGYFLNNCASFWTINLSVIYRNLIIFAHNTLIIILAMLFFKIQPGWSILLAIPALLLISIFAGLMGILISLICTRFRDIIQIVSSIMTVAFLISPVMWMPEFLPPTGAWLLQWNPVSHLIGMFVDPILNRPINVMNWKITIIWIAGLAIIAPLAIGRWQKRVIYWI